MVQSKIEGQNIVLEKYGLIKHDLEALGVKLDSLKVTDPDSFRKKLTGIEGMFTEHYFKQILGMLPEKIRPEKRKKFKAYDGTNNLFNLAYEVLKWKIHKAIMSAKMEPYLGFLHSVQYGKPSLVCDLQELYRYLVDDFVIQFCKGLKESDFIVKSESATRKKKGKREYLNGAKTSELEQGLDEVFKGKVDVPLIRHGSRQRLETLINEEALLLAKYLRNEVPSWIPRLPD